MDPLKAYAIPVRGLREGLHEYRFQLDWRFFRQFENSPIDKAEIDIQMNLEKKSDHLQAEFVLEGHVNTPCDRCLTPIDIPISTREYLIVKYAENAEDEAELVYIAREDPTWNVAQYLYEYSTLALPMNNIIACEEMTPRPCDMKMLEKLKPEEKTQEDNPLWEQLKKISDKK